MATKTYGKAKKLYLDLVELAKSQGYKVLLVNQHKIHDYAGMNPFAGKAMGVPISEDEIWIARNMNWLDKFHTLHHELEEMGRMEGGSDYWSAHKKALKCEDETNSRIMKEAIKHAKNSETSSCKA